MPNLHSSPSTEACNSLIGGRDEFLFGVSVPWFDEEDKYETKAYSGELQQQPKYRSLGLIAGMGYAQSSTQAQSFIGEEQFPPQDAGDIHHLNSYVYSYLDLPTHLQLTLSVSSNVFSDNLFAESEHAEQQVNPKLGLIWNSIPATILRAAAFRVLGGELVQFTRQILEPTQVTGFNLFFNGEYGTGSTQWGVELDHAFSKKLYGGLEYSRRDLDVPVEEQLALT